MMEKNSCESSTSEDDPEFKLRLSKLHSDPATAKKMYDIAVEVFNDLSDVQYMVNIRFRYAEELKLLYLTARNLSSLIEDKIFIPMSSEDQLTPTLLTSIMTYLCKDKKDKSVILALKEKDLTISYFMIAEGLALPYDTGTPDEQERQQRYFQQVVSLLAYNLVPDNASIQLPYNIYPSKDSPAGSVVKFASLKSLITEKFNTT